MSDDTLNGAETAAGPAFTVEKVYVKDVSFEAPGTPQVFNEAGQPQLQMNLNQRVQRLNENAFEVVLGVTPVTSRGRTRCACGRPGCRCWRWCC